MVQKPPTGNVDDDGDCGSTRGLVACTLGGPTHGYIGDEPGSAAAGEASYRCSRGVLAVVSLGRLWKVFVLYGLSSLDDPGLRSDRLRALPLFGIHTFLLR